MADEEFPIGPFIRGLNTRDKIQRIGNQALRKLRNAYILDDASVKARKGLKKFGQIGAASIEFVFQFEDRGKKRYDFAITGGKLFQRNDADGLYFEPKNNDGFSTGFAFSADRISNTFYIADSGSVVRIIDLDTPQELYVADITDSEIDILGGDDLSYRRSISTTLPVRDIAVDGVHYYTAENTFLAGAVSIRKRLKSDDSIVLTLADPFVGRLADSISIDELSTKLYYAFTEQLPSIFTAIRELNKSDLLTSASATVKNAAGSDFELRSMKVDNTFFYTAGFDTLAGGGSMFVGKYKLSDIAALATVTPVAQFTSSLGAAAGSGPGQITTDDFFVYVVLNSAGSNDKDKIFVIRKSDMKLVRTVGAIINPYGLAADDGILYIQQNGVTGQVTALIKSDVVTNSIVIRSLQSSALSSVGQTNALGIAKSDDLTIKDSGSPDAPELEEDNTGAEIAAGVYKGRFTWLEPRGESSGGLITNALTLGIAARIRVGRIPVHTLPNSNSTPVTGRRYYRTEDGGDEFFLVDTGIVLDAIEFGELLGNLRFPPPTAIPNSAGTGLSPGIRSYKYTFVEPLGETEGTQASVRVTLTSSSNVTVSNILDYETLDGSTSPVTSKNLYRTVDGGTTYFFVASIAVGVTEFIDANTDATIQLNAILDPHLIDNQPDSDIVERQRVPKLSAVAPAARWVVRYKSRIFANPIDIPDSFVWNLAPQPGAPNPDYWPVANIQAVGNDGSLLNTGFVLNETFYVATADRIFPFILITDSDATLGPEIVGHTGIVGARAVTVVEGIAYFWGKLGIYAFDGARAILISDKITPDIQAVDPTTRDLIRAEQDTVNERIFFFTGDGTKGFVYDYRKSVYNDPERAIWSEIDFDPANLTSISRVEDTNNNPVVRAGFSDGRIQDLEQTELKDEDLNEIPVEIETGFISMQDDISRWTPHQVSISFGGYLADLINTTLVILEEQSNGQVSSGPKTSRTYLTGGPAQGDPPADSLLQEKFPVRGLSQTVSIQLKWARQGIGAAPTQLFDLSVTGTRPERGLETKGKGP